MNTDKIMAESIARDYAPRSTSKITALNTALLMDEALIDLLAMKAD